MVCLFWYDPSIQPLRSSSVMPSMLTTHCECDSCHLHNALKPQASAHVNLAQSRRGMGYVQAYANMCVRAPCTCTTCRAPITSTADLRTYLCFAVARQRIPTSLPTYLVYIISVTAVTKSKQSSSQCNGCSSWGATFSKVRSNSSAYITYLRPLALWRSQRRASRW